MEADAIDKGYGIIGYWSNTGGFNSLPLFVWLEGPCVQENTSVYASFGEF